MSKNDFSVSQRGIGSRLLCVRMTLQDVIYVTYALHARTLQPLVPKALKLAAVGDDVAFISLVVLRSTRVRLSSLPVFRFNYKQFNIRTYVIDPISKQPAVYFIRSGVTSRFISLATNALGIPWERIEIKTDFSSAEEVRTVKISGDWEGYFSIKAQAEANSLTLPSYFQDRKSAVDFLIRPLIGFSGDSRRLVRFTIQHPEVQPESWVLEGLDCPLFTKLVAIDTNNPHSVFYLPVADFSIYLPPKRIKSKR
jgi:Uncharacterized conserved protein (COG2071)